MKFFSKDSSRHEQIDKRDVISRDEPASSEATVNNNDLKVESTSTNERVDESAIGVNVLTELTNRFALIDTNNSSDLKAVGAALIQIPGELSPVSGDFSSFRHEVLYSILSAAAQSGELRERCDVLFECLNAVDLIAEEATKVDQLNKTVVAVIEDILGGDNEYLNVIRSKFDISDMIENRESLSNSHCIEDQIYTELPVATEGIKQSSHPDVFILTDGGVGSEKHAGALSAINKQARERLIAERESIEESISISEEINSQNFIDAINKSNEIFLATLLDLLDEEEQKIEQYNQVCKDILNVNDRIAESQRCIRYIEAGVRGDVPDISELDPNNEWLISLVGQLAEINSQQTALSLQKGESIKEQLSDIQAETDALQEAIKSIGADTLEPPSPVMQSLIGQDVQSNSDSKIDYEDSIGRYIDWMTLQRSQIRDYKQKLEVLEKEMLDIEHMADASYEADLERLRSKKNEVSKSLSEALKSAHKDADQSESIRVALESDALLLLSQIDECALTRRSFMATVEETMAGTMIRIGRTIDELEGLSSENLDAQT